jgi:hypothetical protein
MICLRGGEFSKTMVPVMSGSMQRLEKKGRWGTAHLGLRAARSGILFSETVPASSKRTMPMRLVHGSYSSTCRQRDWDQIFRNLKQMSSLARPQDFVSQHSTSSPAKDGGGFLTFSSWHVVSIVHITALAFSIISALTSSLSFARLRRGAKTDHKISLQDNQSGQEIRLRRLFAAVLGNSSK